MDEDYFDVRIRAVENPASSSPMWVVEISYPAGIMSFGFTSRSKAFKYAEREAAEWIAVPPCVRAEQEFADLMGYKVEIEDE